MKKFRFSPLHMTYEYSAMTAGEFKNLKISEELFLKGPKDIGKEVGDIRGRILNALIGIEQLMDNIIASYFSKNIDIFLDFKSSILSKSQVTTMLKWKILRDIIDESEFFKDMWKDKKNNFQK